MLACLLFLYIKYIFILFYFLTVPEDNVERLRNIRDMFENTDQTDEQLQLKKVEKLQPSDKIKDIFLKYAEKQTLRVIFFCFVLFFAFFFTVFVCVFNNITFLF